MAAEGGGGGGPSIYAQYVFNAEDGKWYEPSKWEESWSEACQCPVYWNTETGEMVWYLSGTGAASVQAAKRATDTPAVGKGVAELEPPAETDSQIQVEPAERVDAEAEAAVEESEVAVLGGDAEDEAECDAWIEEGTASAVGSDAEASTRPPAAASAAPSGGGRMSKDLSRALARRLQFVEAHTYESRPAPSTADATCHLQGLEFNAPPAKDWIRQFADPEEDRVAEVLACDLEERGARPAHAPAANEPEEQARLSELTQLVWSLRDQLSSERHRSRGQDLREEALARREAEIEAQERELEEQREECRRRAEERRHYPPPPWLPEPDGTINVGVVGNSGVGKSLLINQLRGLNHGMEGWAAVGINETTVKVAMYAFPSEHRVRLWDFPGAGTPDFPLDSYIARMGLRYLDKVLIVSAGRFTVTEVKLMGHLRECRVPYCMVRTKVDIDVWNNSVDNGVDEETSIREIRDDLRENHGVDKVFLVSLRDTGAHDFPRLLSAVFPRLGALRDGSPEVQGWDSAWSIPEVYSEIVSAIQGRWKDKQGTMYIVQGLQVHVTAAAGGTTESATAMLSEADGKVYWLRQWAVGAEGVARSRRKGELRWTPCEDRLRDMVWKWCD